MNIKNAILGFGLITAATLAQAAPVASVFTNSSTLDFSGNFVYAVTMNPNAAGMTIGDANFTYGVGGSTAGVSETHVNYIQNWHISPGYGGTPADLALQEVMRSIIWTGYNGTNSAVTLTMSNLVVGETYKAQLLFGEQCCERAYDVFQDGNLIYDNFSAWSLNNAAGNYPYWGSAVLSNTFVATSSSVTFGLGGAGDLFDSNPILNAATLERVGNNVPEPGSLALLLGSLGLLGLRGRRRPARVA